MASKHLLTVIVAERGRPLAPLLSARLSVPAALAEGWVRGGSTYLDGRRQRDPDHPVRPGQRIKVLPPERAPGPVAPLVLAYADRDLAVVDKPAGLHSVPSRRGGPSLEGLCARELGAGCRLMHRLDRETSGLLLVSRRGGRIRKDLARQIARHSTTRRYLALGCGEPAQAHFTVESRLSVSGGRSRITQDPRARPAVTMVRVLRRLPGRALLQVELRTGRTHQVRAHLAERDLPLLGDLTYGGDAASRLCLHAHCLGFVHPRRGAVEAHSPLPAAMRLYLTICNK